MDIIVLHGWGHSSEMWTSFAGKFHAHKATALDLPGFGKEKLASENWDTSDYADWVVKKIKAKNIKNAILIGHSFGGKVATEIAINNPKLARKLVLVASPLLRRPSTSTKIKIAIYKLVKKTLPVGTRKLFFAEEYKEANKNNLGEIFKNSVEYDRTMQLSALKIPTLIVWGENDDTAPLPVAKEMHKLIPNSKLEIIKGGGHNLHLENPDILYGIISKFVNEHN